MTTQTPADREAKAPPEFVEDAPRTSGDVAQSPSVQIGLIILLVMLALLGLWVAWSLLSAS